MALNPLLAGPILRRTDAQGVHVWLATRDTSSVELFIFDGDGIEIGASTAEGGFHRQVALGQHLHVHLMKAVPSGDPAAFPSDTLLSYDLRVNGADLAALGLIGDDGINYPGHSLPSFSLHSGNAPVLHGSCRKPHGYEKAANLPEDALATTDRWMASRATEPSTRPAALFLSGDQIYADDVAAPLLDHLMRLAPELTGLAEHLPGKGPHGASSLNPADIDLYDRQRYLKRARFSSGHMENHLMSFGEYAAMYLVVWGGIAPDLRTWNHVYNHVRDAYPDNDEYSYAPGFMPDNTRDLYLRQLDVLRVFAKTLWRVRRLLANVPTYMIADDHEVTDDWFINTAWRKRVLASQRGKRVISNAMAAYWAFQAWGNDPDAFSQEFIDALSEHLVAPKLSGAKAIAFETAVLDRPGNWGFVAPTKPPVIALDTRTRRVNNGADDGPAQLMDADSLQWLHESWQQTRIPTDSDHPPLIVVSPTPVLGFSPLEFLQRKGYKWVSVEKLDFESWSADQTGYIALQTLLHDMKPEWALILSGDVHYTFTKHAPTLAEFPVWQCTNSPILNSPTGKFILRALSTQEYKKHKQDYVIPAEHRDELVMSRGNVGLINFGENGPLRARLIVAGAPNDETWTYPLT